MREILKHNIGTCVRRRAGTPVRVRARNANSTKLSNAKGGRGGWLLYIVPSTHFTAIFQNRVKGGGGALGYAECGVRSPMGQNCYILYIFLSILFQLVLGEFLFV